MLRPGHKKMDEGGIHMERSYIEQNTAERITTGAGSRAGSGTRRTMERYIIILLSLLLAALVTWFFLWRSGIAAERQLQEHLAQEVLRFHILANSDSEEDQALKITVRDRVLDYLDEEMPEATDAQETARWMRRHVEELEEVSRKTVTGQGYEYPVNAAVTTCWFPDRTYGDMTFPAGNYEALRIELGDAQGHNWWCVLYPGLCFLDAANAVVPEEGKQKLQNVLTEDEYSQITATTDFQIKWFFPEKWKG